MHKDNALARLRPLEDTLRRQGISALFLFGSVARGDATETSDVDIAFDVERTVRFSLFDQARVGHVLGDALRMSVDLVPLEGLRPALRKRIEADMVRVF